MLVTMEVYDELSRSKSLLKPLAEALGRGNMEILESSDFTDLQHKYPELGIGELSIIASGKGKIVFIEDRKAEETAKGEGLLVFNLPELLLACKHKGLVSKAEMKQITEELRNKDKYLFKEGIEEELLK